MRLEQTSPNAQSPVHSASNGSPTNGTLPPLSGGTSKPSSNGAASTSTATNGHSQTETLDGIFSNGAAATTHTIADDELWHGHSKKEVTRILIQSLGDLGFPAAARQLSKESGLELERPHVATFRQAVLHGEWAEAESILFGLPDEGGGGGDAGQAAHEVDGSSSSSSSRGKHASRGGSSTTWQQRQQQGLPLAENANRSQMQFWMRQQKYLELLEKRDLGAALTTLRSELTPLNFDMGRLHQLSSLMMCQSAEDVQMQADWDGAAGESRSLLLSELSRCISPSVMLPEHRFASLLDQVKDTWVQSCLYHNTSESPSLVIDHSCRREDFPLKKLCDLRHHQDEVWFLAFSPDGTMLATAGKDQAIFIYDTRDFKVRQQWVNKHKAGVCYLSFSPDSKRLISCGKEQDNTAIVWDAHTGDILHIISTFTYAVTAAAWNPTDSTFVIASQDSEWPLVVYSSRTYERLFVWREDNLRVYDIAISPDGSRLVALLESRILVFDPSSRQKVADWTMPEGRLTSVQISRDSRHMLVGMNENRIKLMAIDTGEELRSFGGHRQSQYMIRSAFGGANETFVVSGSEDSKVYIWRTNGTLVEEWEAHRPGCVNTVAWHPTKPAMFASAGDDSVVRVWANVDYAMDHQPSLGPGQVSNGDSR